MVQKADHLHVFNTVVKIYVSDLPATNLLYKTPSSLCYQGYQDGMAVCSNPL